MKTPLRIDSDLYDQAKSRAKFDPKTRHLLLLGSHENFYRELKR